MASELSTLSGRCEETRDTLSCEEEQQNQIRSVQYCRAAGQSSTRQCKIGRDKAKTRSMPAGTSGWCNATEDQSRARQDPRRKLPSQQDNASELRRGQSQVKTSRQSQVEEWQEVPLVAKSPVHERQVKLLHRVLKCYIHKGCENNQ